MHEHYQAFCFTTLMRNTSAPSSSPDKELLVFNFKHHHALNIVMIPVQIESEREAGPMAGAAESPLESNSWKQRKGARSASASPLPKKSSTPCTNYPRCLVKHAQLRITEFAWQPSPFGVFVRPHR